MKVCDKCKKELPPNFMQTPDPYFIIYKWSNMTNINIDLCPSCCKKLDKWLKNESYHCVYNKECIYEENNG